MSTISERVALLYYPAKAGAAALAQGQAADLPRWGAAAVAVLSLAEISSAELSGYTVAIRQGDLVRAAAYLDEGLVLQHATGDAVRLAAMLNNLANVACMQGDYARAVALFTESLMMQRERGGTEGLAIALSNLGYAAWHQRDCERASAFLEESLALWRELGDREGVAIALTNLGEVACLQGDLARAAALQVESLALFRELGGTWGALYCLQRVALVAHASGHPPDIQRRAAALFSAVTALRATLGMPLPPNEQARIDGALAALRTVLGEAAFAAAWANGQSMDLEQVSTYALATAAPLLPGHE